jgi:uncharacterized protein (TIGR02246 family)
MRLAELAGERYSTWVIAMNTTELISAKQAILETNRAFSEAFAGQDAAALAALYTENSEILPPNMDAMRGRKAIQAFWEKVMGMGVKHATLDSVEIEAADSMAWETGRYTLRGADAQVLDHGKYIVIWRREEDHWRLHRDIWNSSVSGTAN